MGRNVLQFISILTSVLGGVEWSKWDSLLFWVPLGSYPYILLETASLFVVGFLLFSFLFLFWFPITVLNLQDPLAHLAPLFPQPPRALKYYAVSTPISQSFPAHYRHKSLDRISNRSHHYQTTSVLAQTSLKAALLKANPAKHRTLPWQVIATLVAI